MTQENLDAVTQEVTQLEGVARQFDAVQAESKKLLEAAAPLLVAADERGAWAAIVDDLGSKLPRRYIWVTELVPLVDGKQPYTIGDGSAGASPVSASPAAGPAKPGATPAAAPKIDALRVSGLYLSSPPNENSQPQAVVDEFVNNLLKSPVFKIEEKEKSRVIIERQTPDGQKWAYNFTLVLPLRNPIALP